MMMIDFDFGFWIFLFCVVAALAHVASDPGSYVATLGASGAISGLLGAYAVSYPGGRLRLLWPRVRVPALLFLALWVALQVASGLAAAERGDAGIAWWAHIGGFAAGLVLIKLMESSEHRGGRNTPEFVRGPDMWQSRR